MEFTLQPVQHNRTILTVQPEKSQTFPSTYTHPWQLSMIRLHKIPFSSLHVCCIGASAICGQITDVSHPSGLFRHLPGVVKHFV